MKTEFFEFKGYNGIKLPAVLWLPDGDPKQILQITHGMTEHMGRYTALAEVLTEAGIAVAGFDLRGHGKNPGDPDIASFGEGGWDAAIEDMKRFFCIMKERLPGISHTMLGFSLGSFLVREYLAKYPDGVDRAVIMGTGHQPGVILSVMMAIVKGQFKKNGFDGTTALVKRLSFGTYNEKFKPNRTAADWLCADQNQLDDYLADPLCRKDISAGLFWQMLGAMKRTCGKNAYIGWNKEIRILLLSGQDDPVGDAGKGIRAFKAAMEKVGIGHVTMHLFPGARHDILHEELCGGADQTRRFIRDWLINQ